MEPVDLSTKQACSFAFIGEPGNEGNDVKGGGTKTFWKRECSNSNFILVIITIIIMFSWPSSNNGVEI
jgi:hypothetical protein